MYLRRGVWVRGKWYRRGVSAKDLQDARSMKAARSTIVPFGQRKAKSFRFEEEEKEKEVMYQLSRTVLSYQMWGKKMLSILRIR